jgi:hypothetical protein
MLFYKRGLQFDWKEVGFAKGHEQKIEDWIQRSLGLGEQPGPGDPAGVEPSGTEDGKPAAKVGPNLAPGVINMPGDGDQGFEFELETATGKPLKFGDYRGKVVVVPLLLAGEASSAQLAKALVALQAKYAKDGLEIAGACFGRAREAEQKKREVVGFATEHGIGFPLGLAELSFIRKIHNPGAFPLTLVFDRQGVLVQRLPGHSAELEGRLEEGLRRALGLDL